MTSDQFVDLVLREEGTTYAEPPHIDQPTGPGGVTVPELTAFRGTPQTAADLRLLTIAEAKQIIVKRFHDPDLARLADDALRVQVLDFAYNSGKATAVRWLQRTANAFLPVTDQLTVDGVLGNRTIDAINRLPAIPVNNALAAERAHAAYHGAVAPAFAAGVAHRAVEFVEML